MTLSIAPLPPEQRHSLAPLLEAYAAEMRETPSFSWSLFLQWVLAATLAWLVGAVPMVAGYLLGGALYVGLPTALLEVPLNVLQTVVGALVGIPLVFAVRRAYPPVDRLGQRSKWTE